MASRSPLAQMPRPFTLSRRLGSTDRVTQGLPSDQPSSMTLENPSEGEVLMTTLCLAIRRWASSCATRPTSSTLGVLWSNCSAGVCERPVNRPATVKLTCGSCRARVASSPRPLTVAPRRCSPPRWRPSKVRFGRVPQEAERRYLARSHWAAPDSNTLQPARHSGRRPTWLFPSPTAGTPCGPGTDQPRQSCTAHAEEYPAGLRIEIAVAGERQEPRSADVSCGAHDERREERPTSRVIHRCPFRRGGLGTSADSDRSGTNPAKAALRIPPASQAHPIDRPLRPLEPRHHERHIVPSPRKAAGEKRNLAFRTAR